MPHQPNARKRVEVCVGAVKIGAQTTQVLSGATAQNPIEAVTAAKPTAQRKLPLLINLLLIAGTVAIYWPLKDCDFTNFDDPEYVTRNAHVVRGLTWWGVSWAFTQMHAGNWHPLTWISHMIDCQVFGLNPAGHHFVNLGFHIANTLLLFLLFRQMTGATWRSALVAALFAWHPLHVESVAWISERKDVLSTFFGLLAMLAYVRYAQQSNVQGPRSKVAYALALVCFALSLLSKGMLVTLPFVLLLIDYWPLGRWGAQSPRSKVQGRVASNTHHVSRFTFHVSRQLLLEKLPFLALSILFSAVTFYVQNKTGAVIALEQKPFPDRCINVLHSYLGYLGNLLYPRDLCIYYFAQWQNLRFALPLTVLAVLTLLAILAARRWRYAPTGWFWYVGTLVPVIGLVQVGSQAMADRYTYLPSIGIFAVLAWAGAELFRRLSQWSAGLICGAWLVVLATATWLQVQYWTSSIFLFTHALQAGEVSALAHHNLGHGLMETTNQRNEAMWHFRRALALFPGYPQAHLCLANCLSVEGRLDEAETNYREASRNKPRYAEAYYGLGNVLALKGRPEEARKCFEEALRLRPYYPEAHTKLGNLLLLQGDREAGLKHLRAAVEYFPAYADGRYYLGTACAEQKQFEEAILNLGAASKLKPRDPAPLNDLAWILAAEPAARRNPDQAVRLATRACQFTAFKEPRYLDTLAVAYAANRQTNDARLTCQHALDLARTATNTALVRHLEAQLKQWTAASATNTSTLSP